MAQRALNSNGRQSLFSVEEALYTDD